MFLFFSLGGGTGSGLGSRLLEYIKTEFPELFVVNIAVFPNEIGENALQNYNTLLSLNKLIEYSDCVFHFDNNKINNYLLQNNNNPKLNININFNDINEFIM